MTVALILLIILLGSGSLLYLHDRLTRPKDAAGDEPVAEETPRGEECCGMHITCEKDSLVAGMDTEIVYYDDEELDRYCGRADNEYDDGAIEEFREVLITLRPEEIAGWARSITMRGITLPSAVRDELLMIVAEARNAKQ